MPIHHHKREITPTPPSSTRQQTAPALPDQQIFRQYLRELAREGIRVVLEDGLARGTQCAPRSGMGRKQPQAQGISQRLLPP
jgi:hypothetical protein